MSVITINKETFATLTGAAWQASRQHLHGISANKFVTVVSHMTACIVVRNVMQAVGTFDDAQDNCHTAVPAFPMLRIIHLVNKAVTICRGVLKTWDDCHLLSAGSNTSAACTQLQNSASMLEKFRQ